MVTVTIVVITAQAQLTFVSCTEYSVDSVPDVCHKIHTEYVISCLGTGHGISFGSFVINSYISAEYIAKSKPPVQVCKLFTIGTDLQDYYITTGDNRALGRPAGYKSEASIDHPHIL